MLDPKRDLVYEAYIVRLAMRILDGLDVDAFPEADLDEARRWLEPAQKSSSGPQTVKRAFAGRR